MAKHAVKSPSAEKRWGSCPGSIALSKGRKDPSSAYADEGTAAHFLGSECLLNDVDAASYIGAVIELRQLVADEEHYEAWGHEPHRNDTVLSKFVVDDDMAEAVQVYVDYVRDLVKSTGGVLFVEVSVPIDHLTGEEDATGTSDTVIVAEEEIIVVDLKYGRGVEVSAIENGQMRIYASGAIRYIDDLVGGAEKIKSVRMAISQPRISKLPSEWACTIEELRAFEEKVKCASNVCDEATAAFHDTKHVDFRDWTAKYLTSSEDACRFCRAKAHCPALSSFVEEVTLSDFTDLDAVPPKSAPASPDNELLGAHLKAVDLVEIWCKAVRAEAESQLLQGNAVPGYKLVQGKMGNRSWIDEKMAESTLKKLKLKKDEMYETKLRSPTQIEKVIGAKSDAWPLVQKVITQKEGGLSVAPESDRRPAVEVAPITEGFTPLTD